MSKLQKAQELAARGFKVFLLKENAKTPLKPGKFLDQATSNKDIIDILWTKYPNGNIGIATGEGLVVIDVDTLHHGGENGSESLKNYEITNGLLNDTFTVETPTGGKHIYYVTNNECKNATGLLPGVDIRGTGGYVVAPGSIINGKEYKIVKDVPIAKPNYAVETLLKKCKTPKVETDPFAELEKGYSNNLVQEGNRTSYLVGQVGQLCDGTKSINTIENMIRVLNEQNLEVPLTEDELVKEVFPAIKRFKKHEEKAIKKELLKDPKEVKLVSVDSIKKEFVKWLVPGYIPEGAITVIGGDGGLGKTTLWCNIASAISNGTNSILQEDNDYIYPNGNVIYFSGEDDTASVLRYKLESNNANLSNISTIPLDDEIFSDIAIGSELLEGIIENHRPKLVIFDPIQQFIKDTDMTKRNDMRQTLTSLTRLGKLYGTTFILVMHTNKRANIGSFRDKLSDSADIWDISRSVLAVGRNPDGECFITHEKSSYCARQSAVLYHIDDGKIYRDGFDSERQTYVDFMGGKAKANKSDTKKQLKEVYLELVESGGKVIKKELENRLLKMGYTNNMIRNVYNELLQEEKITKEKTSNGNGNITYLCTSISSLL